MKTVTEFAAITIKNAAKAHQELQAAGKTPEELPQALGEALKLEGDKLTWIQAALEIVGGKLDDLKRVLVISLNEGEKPPLKSVQKGDHYFQAEYYPPLNPPKAARGEHGKDSRHGGKGKGGKGDRGKKRGRGGRRDGKPGEGREAQGAPREGAGGEGSAGEGGQRRRRRPPRGPRPDAQAPQTGPKPPLPKPRNLQAAPAAAPAATSEAAPAETPKQE